jgi:orotidine-5'-phosphate decarboxylase
MTTADPRDHLVLVLDIERLDDALAYAERMSPWFGIVKVGYELYGAAGPEAFFALHSKGFRVFADLKLYDIPTTVERGARAIGRHGVEFLNFHAAGGETMLRAGLDGLRDGARDAGHAQPIALAVTVLTSDANVDALESRMQTAEHAGFDGVVCGGPDVAIARAHHLRTMVPGIRLPGGDAHDQARVDTPGDAIRRGADWLVVGRAVAAADDPERAAEETTRDVAAALGRMAG